MKTRFIITIFTLTITYILHAANETSVTLEQTRSQILNQNKINYLSHKGGYLKKMATGNSALTKEAIRRGMSRYSNGSSRDASNDGYYNEQLTYKSNDIENVSERGTPINTSEYLDTEDDNKSEINTLANSNNTAEANLVAAETIYLEKEAAYNAIQADYDSAAADEEEAFPEWDTSRLLKAALEKASTTATELSELNTERDNVNDKLAALGLPETQESFTEENARNLRETKRLAKVAAEAQDALIAVEEWETATAAETVALTNKEVADSAVSSSTTTLNAATNEYDTAAQTEADALIDKNNAQTALDEDDGSDPAVTSSLQDALDTATAEYTSAQTATAENLSAKNDAEANHQNLVTAQTAANTAYTDALAETSSKLSAKNSKISIFNSNTEGNMAYDGSDASSIYSTVKTNYETNIGSSVTDDSLSDSSSLKTTYENAQNLYSAVSDRDSAQDDYNTAISDYNTAAASYNTTRDNNLVSIPDEHQATYTELSSYGGEEDVPDTIAASDASDAASENYDNVNTPYQNLLTERKTQRALLENAGAEMDSAWNAVLSAQN